MLDYTKPFMLFNKYFAFHIDANELEQSQNKITYKAYMADAKKRLAVPVPYNDCVTC